MLHSFAAGTMNQASKASVAKFIVAVLIGLVIGVGIWAFLRKESTLSSALASRRGDTVERLRIIRHSLESYRAQHGKLPARLEDLGLNSTNLMDSQGKPFIYVAGKSSKQSPLGRIIVTVSAPVAHFSLSKDKWAYAIVEDSNHRLFIQGTTKYEEVSP